MGKTKRKVSKEEEKMNKTMRKAIALGKVEQAKKDTLETPCVACSGSGYYDVEGSPPCGSCHGTGFKYFNGSVPTPTDWY